METYICEGSCDTRDCDDMCHVWDAAEDYQCTRSRGHTGPHVACSSEECNMMEWWSKNRKRVPLTKEVWAGPISITIGRVALEITTPEVILLSVDERRVSLQPEDLKRLIRALVMAANLQRTANSKACESCDGFGAVLEVDSNYPVQRCDTCGQFESDYDAWLSLIPDGTRLSVDDDE